MTETKGLTEISWQAEDGYLRDPEDLRLLSAYQAICKDVVGIIRIDKTVLNHPVVQTPEDEEYYLYRDLEGNYNSHGVPFLSALSDMESQGQNMVIYGHNIHKNSRDIFCDLANYKDVDYYRAHPVIETVSASGTRRWLIFAYFIVDNADEHPFKYSEVTRFLAKKDLETYLSEIKRRNWLDTKISVTYGDSLITLSSCSLELAGSGTNRMVVVGRLLKADEDIQEIVAQAAEAQSPLLPAKLEGKF